jgi:hypothetical protein
MTSILSPTNARSVALEGHQHPANLIPCEGTAIDHQQGDLPCAFRIPRDAANQMACVSDPPAELPSLHMAGRDCVPDPVVERAEQVPHVGVEVTEDRELVALLLVGHPLSRVQRVTRWHEHRSKLERVLDAVEIWDGDGLQRRVVEGDAHHGGRLLVEAPVAAEADVGDGNALA